LGHLGHLPLTASPPDGTPDGTPRDSVPSTTTARRHTPIPRQRSCRPPSPP